MNANTTNARGLSMDALERQLNPACNDTGGSKRCAMFLLLLWNGDYFKAEWQAGI